MINNSFLFIYIKLNLIFYFFNTKYLTIYLKNLQKDFTKKYIKFCKINLNFNIFFILIIFTNFYYKFYYFINFKIFLLN
jgi:hypothetical protein